MARSRSCSTSANSSPHRLMRRQRAKRLHEGGERRRVPPPSHSFKENPHERPRHPARRRRPRADSLTSPTPSVRRSSSPRPHPQQPSRRRLGWRIGAVAAAALTAIGLACNLGGSSAEARADERLAEAAINAVDPVAQPGQYWKIVTTTSVGTATSGEDIDEDGASLAGRAAGVEVPMHVEPHGVRGGSTDRDQLVLSPGRTSPRNQGLLGIPGDWRCG